MRVANMSTVWTFLYERPARFNWMFQFYLRKHGLWLSWVGSGRMIFSLDYSDSDYAQVADRIVAAAQEMQADGWWSGPALSNRAIKRRVFREMFN